MKHNSIIELTSEDICSVPGVATINHVKGKYIRYIFGDVISIELDQLCARRQENFFIWQRAQGTMIDKLDVTC